MISWALLRNILQNYSALIKLCSRIQVEFSFFKSYFVGVEAGETALKLARRWGYFIIFCKILCEKGSFELSENIIRYWELLGTNFGSLCFLRRSRPI